MRKKGKNLVFISRILRDGKNVEIIEEFPKHLSKELFELKPLSLTKKTFIASGFNTYVVRIKSK